MSRGITFQRHVENHLRIHIARHLIGGVDSDRLTAAKNRVVLALDALQNPLSTKAFQAHGSDLYWQSTPHTDVLDVVVEYLVLVINVLREHLDGLLR